MEFQYGNPFSVETLVSIGVLQSSMFLFFLDASAFFPVEVRF